MRPKHIFVAAVLPVLYLIAAFIALDWCWVISVTGEDRAIFVGIGAILTGGAITFPDN